MYTGHPGHYHHANKLLKGINGGSNGPALVCPTPQSLPPLRAASALHHQLTFICSHWLLALTAQNTRCQHHMSNKSVHAGWRHTTQHTKSTAQTTLAVAALVCSATMEHTRSTNNVHSHLHTPQLRAKWPPPLPVGLPMTPGTLHCTACCLAAKAKVLQTLHACARKPSHKPCEASIATTLLQLLELHSPNT